ncbi:cysteine dioxygenase [Acinetobacter qingfengensis]|uniref:Cysteine dioxygenase n=1 Tax=Acinetobacter qingfengensis TaxID=1262585 RepID=A0A1E7QWG8_9GAMM|nr:cysteine dioxygenase [Acinetobacter qingfengensis]KAA8731314.1 cysteine dioxygenase [Acinetobacter qingfengensis]OEY91439.1 cysteine dioxygenase [Acinetobacter qingfengensis]
MSLVTGRFKALIDKIESSLAQNLADTLIIESFIPEFKALLADIHWLPEIFQHSDPQHYQQYLLYKDPQVRFSIVSFVWGPGQKTPIHNHEVWGAVGVIQGAEISQRFAWKEQKLRPVASGDVLQVGDIDWFTPASGDVHQVSNAFADQVSISIHIYGADIGQVKRFTYSPTGEAKVFISGYSNKELRK